jgi:hypothetical protein
MGNLIFNGLAGRVLPQDGVKASASGVELTLKNPLPKVVMHEFKIEKITQYAEIFLNGELITEELYRKMRVTIKEKIMELPELEQMAEVVIPHSPPSTVWIPIPIQAGQSLSLKMVVKLKKPLVFEITRTVQ